MGREQSEEIELDPHMFRLVEVRGRPRSQFADDACKKSKNKIIPSCHKSEVNINLDFHPLFHPFHSPAMADSPQSVPTHPIAPRILNHVKKPHVGPDIQAYQDHHGQTIGDGSDEWWAQVRPHSLLLSVILYHLTTPCHRSPGKRFTGIALSRQFVLVASRPEI